MLNKLFNLVSISSRYFEYKNYKYFMFCHNPVTIKQDRFKFRNRGTFLMFGGV